MNLRISEQFYSIQGEGVSSGSMAVFLRLQGCNLLCGGNGSSWTCDTIDVWKKGTRISFSEIVSDWREKGWCDALISGARLIVTGGEPLLQQKQLALFLDYLDEQLGRQCFVECETNGTVVPDSYLQKRVQQWNVSPKLANSGMALERRVSDRALSCFSSLDTVWYKFVVSCEEDVREAFSTYIDPYSLNRHNVIVMPAADSQRHIAGRFFACDQWATLYNVQSCSRLQLHIWDKVTGV